MSSFVFFAMMTPNNHRKPLNFFNGPKLMTPCN